MSVRKSPLTSDMRWLPWMISSLVWALLFSTSLLLSLLVFFYCFSFSSSGFVDFDRIPSFDLTWSNFYGLETKVLPERSSSLCESLERRAVASIIWACFSKKLALKALEFVLDIAEILSSGNLDALVIIKSPSGKLILAADACAIALRMLLNPLPIAWLRDYVDLFLVVYDWLLIDIGCFEESTLPSLAA